MSQQDRDYVLGTHDAEIARLGLQHEVWRPHMLEAWNRASLRRGDRVLDLGCGPGFATFDLAEAVGPQGEVVAVERSARFAAVCRDRCPAGAGRAPVRVHELDLMADPLPGDGFDMAWCRWVACFVDSPATLVGKLLRCLRPGGRVVFHEYADYATWRYLPARPRLEEFVRQVMASWRATGGEPDIARALPDLIGAQGGKVTQARPLVFSAVPGEPFWEWPAAFIKTNLDRLGQLGRVDADWVAAARAEFNEAAADPRSLVVTPLVLEIVAEKGP